MFNSSRNLKKYLFIERLIIILHCLIKLVIIHFSKFQEYLKLQDFFVLLFKILQKDYIILYIIMSRDYFQYNENCSVTTILTN